MSHSKKPSRDERDANLDEEIRVHLAMAAADRVARGESPNEAALAAKREFGNVGHIKEVTREMWGGVWFERLLQDARYAWRSLARAPGFAIVAILTLALGIGANVAMFTVVNGVLFRRLPFREPSRLVLPSYAPPRNAFFRYPGMDERHYLEYARQARAIESSAVFGETRTTITGAGEPARLTAASVTPGFFSVIGVGPALGRAFAPDDNQPGHDAVIIGDGLWRERFGGQPSVIGKPIVLDGERHTIIGVMPAAFDFPFAARLWMPTDVKIERGRSRIRSVVARLTPGTTEAQALAELTTIFEHLPGESWPVPRDQFVNEVLPISFAVVGDIQRSLLIFGGAVLFVLLIACANVANLLLMRAASRQHEIAVRTALGADRPRLIRQLLTESTLVAFLGGGVGIAIAFVGVRALVSLTPPGLLPRTNEIHIDTAVLAFTAGLCLLTGIGFGLAPALQTSKRSLGAAIGETGRAVSGRRSPLRAGLVVIEIALALVLLTGAGLVARSFLHLRGVELGFEPERVLAMTMNLPPAKYRDATALHAFRDDVLSRLAHLPGVSSAAAVNWRPLGGALIKGDFKLGDGRTLPREYMVSKPAVTPDYFRVMGIRVLEGRAFTERDDARSPGVVLVSTSVAKRLWPDRSPVGERISMADKPKPTDWLTIVGVVDDVIQQGLKDERDAAIYQPMAQVNSTFFLNGLNFVVRTAGDPTVVAASVRDAVGAVDADQPVESLGAMTSLISSTIAEPLFHVRVLTVFSLCALLLAAIGIYGVLAYAVTERTREIGIRVAIGAVPRDVVRMMIGRTMTLAIPGVMLGTAASLALTRVLRGFLFQVEPTDPATLGAVGMLVIVVALAATIVPARRATRVDPLIALRHE